MNRSVVALALLHAAALGAVIVHHYWGWTRLMTLGLLITASFLIGAFSYLTWIAIGEPDVNGDPERDASGEWPNDESLRRANFSLNKQSRTTSND